MLVLIHDTYDAMSVAAAARLADQIRRKPTLTVGLATGSTPIGLYNELIRLHRFEGLDLSKLTTFNLDEYIGLPPHHPQSYHRFMREHLFDHINLDPRFTHVPNGMAQDVDAFCDWYEAEIERAGGLDVQVLGIGANGHIAFNEPGSSLGSRTRIKTLTEQTVADNARFFTDDPERVPRYAITMGIGTIMDARELLLLASGPSKAQAIHDAVEGPISARIPASIIQMHRKAFVYCDPTAASLLEHEYRG